MDTSLSTTDNKSSRKDFIHSRRSRKRIVTLGVPPAEEVNQLIGALTTRYSKQPEEFPSYAYASIDRQIAKASGLLTAYGLLLAALPLGLETAVGMRCALKEISCILLLASCLMCFPSLITTWAPVDVYESADQLGAHLVRRTAARSIWLNCATIIGAVVIAMWLVAALFNLATGAARPVR
jgi:hypothetical protein